MATKRMQTRSTTITHIIFFMAGVIIIFSIDINLRIEI